MLFIIMAVDYKLGRENMYITFYKQSTNEVDTTKEEDFE